MATRPWRIPLEGWKDIFVRTWDELGRDNVSIVAAGVAFFAFLSLLPSLTALVSIVGLVADPVVIQTQMKQWSTYLPPAAASILQDQTTQVIKSASAQLSWAAILSLLLAVYGASKATRSLMTGLTIANNEHKERGFLRLLGTALALTVLLIVGLVCTIALLLAVPVYLKIAGLTDHVSILIGSIRWFIIASLAMIGLSILYRYGPSRDPARWKWVSPGSFIAVLIWIVGSFAFTIYVENFGSYNPTYGALAGIIILLTWFWLSAYIVLLGAELNAQIAHQTRVDTTTDNREPMGARDAAMADTLASSCS